MVPPVQKRSSSAPSEPGDGTKKRKSRQTKKAQSTGEQSSQGMSRNAARERYRVKSLRNAFQNLQSCLPSVPPNTKLSKLDVLILATTYISHLSRILVEDELLQNESSFSLADIFQMDCPSYIPLELETRNPNWEKSYLHPVRKWPMRSRLYAGVEENDSTTNALCPSTQLASQSLQLGQW